MWWAIGLLVLSTAASAALAKRYYDKSLISTQQLDLAIDLHEAQVEKLQKAFDQQKAQAEAVSRALSKQQDDYARSRREAERLRSEIRDLSATSPEVREWLTTHVPADLYDRVWPQPED